MRRARAAAGAALVLAAAAVALPAAAYVRTSDPDTGVEIAWPLPRVAFTFSSASFFAAPSCTPTAAANPAEDAVRASFGAWGSAWCPSKVDRASLALTYGGRIPEIRTGLHATGENLVVIRRGWCSTQVPGTDPCWDDLTCGGIYGCYEDDGPADRSTVALTTVLYDPRTGRIFDADLEVNGWDGVPGTFSTQVNGRTVVTATHGYYFTCDTQPGRAPCATYGEDGCNGYDLANTVTHEAGHFVGLAHPCGDNGISCDGALPPWETVPYDDRAMFWTTEIGQTSKRVLSADDVAGVCAIYPPASGGCGSAGGAPGLLGVALAALALRRRVRR